jgi:hypothetical protein
MAVGDGAQLGYNSWVGVGEQTSYSSKYTSTAFLEFTNFGLAHKREQEKLGEIGSRNYTNIFQKNESVSGPIECYLNVASDAVVYLIKHAFGGTVTTTLSSTVGTVHVMGLGNMDANATLAAGYRPALCFTKRVGDTLKYDYWGCRVNQLTIKGEIDKPIVLTADLVGKTGSTSSETPTVAISTITPLLWHGVTFKTGDPASMTSVAVSGTAEPIQSFEFTLNNNIISGDEARSLGQTTVDLLPVGKRECTLKYSQRYDTSTAYTRAWGLSSTAFGIVITSTQTVGALAGSTTYSMKLEIPRGYVETFDPVISGPGLIKQDIMVTAIEPTATSADLCRCTVINATAAYGG